ncbi:Hypothetical predicted protein [Pelobates cultripes]|uniref:Uncharacterized protein n=1 Tax=Pelobates cultripes TaxID=61616 RepID=A0AAD1S917_PELCU|nr:Hypothetical predicted protein [Pelobates cultripes]
MGTVMVTKSDLQTLADTLTTSLTSWVTALQADVEAQGGRIRALESKAQNEQQQAMQQTQPYQDRVACY